MPQINPTGSEGRKKAFVAFLFSFALLTLVVFIIFTVLRALRMGIEMDTYAANGTFQLYNPLRRMMDGQIPGVDFPFFHGIGVPYLHLPVFVALGSNIFAAEVAKWLVSPLLLLGSAYVIFYSFFRIHRVAVIATSVFVSLAVISIGVVEPGISLNGARSTFPVLVAAALLWQNSGVVKFRAVSFRKNELLAFLSLALSVIFGTEQGVAAIIAYILVKACLSFKSYGFNERSFLNVGLLILGVVSTVFVLFLFFTLGDPVDALRYAFIDIPKSQGWYFGSPPNTFITWNNILPHLLQPSLTATNLTIAGTFLLLVLIIKKSRASLEDYAPFLFMALYGLVVFVAGSFGYYSPSQQLPPLHRMSGIILIIIVVQISLSKFYTLQGTRLTLSEKCLPERVRPYTSIFFFASVFLLTTPVLFMHLQKIDEIRIAETMKTAQSARSSSDYFSSSDGWKRAINTFRPYLNNNKTVWSTYTSVYDSTSNQYNSSSGGEDYIIHALGSNRSASYSSDFKKVKPDTVITLRPKYFPYEEWLWSRHWDFYYELLANYDIVVANESHFLWTASKSLTIEKGVLKYVSSNDGIYKLPKNNSRDIRAYTINIRYASSSGLPLNLLKSIPRYLLQVSSNISNARIPISLPPDENNWSFPVFIQPGEEITISDASAGMTPHAQINLEAMTFTPFLFNDTPLVMDAYCTQLRKIMLDNKCVTP